MFIVLVTLSTTTIIIGLLSYFTVQQYRRVQKRDQLRRRTQIHQSSSTQSFQYDPLDHSLYWYPIAFSYELSLGSRRPLSFHLLNQPLCLYRSNNGQVVCLLDLCPHRSAPLSLGQITKDGNLECIYHGWQYGTNGQCVYIPSVSKTSNTSSLICARTIPVHEQYGYIWIWPGKAELADSNLVPHHLFSDLQCPNTQYLLSPENAFHLDIPYDLMVDNLLDLAHVDFTHDQTIGKRSQASCIRSEKLQPSPFESINNEVFSYRVTKHELSFRLPSNECVYFHFIPPCFIRLENYRNKQENKITQLFMIIPCAETKLRFLAQIYRNFACYKWIEYIPGYDYLMEKFNKRIIDQDVLLLNGIYRNITEMGAKPLGKIVSADQPIKEFRQFQTRVLDKYKTIYMKRDTWMTKSSVSNDGKNEIDIEDLIME